MCMDASTIRKAASANHRWLHNRRQSRPSLLPHLLPFRPLPRPRRPSVLLTVTVTVTEDVASSAAVTGNRDPRRRLLQPRQCLHLYRRLWWPSRHPLLSSRRSPQRPSVLLSKPGSARHHLQFRHPRQDLPAPPDPLSISAPKYAQRWQRPVLSAPRTRNLSSHLLPLPPGNDPQRNPDLPLPRPAPLPLSPTDVAADHHAR